MFFSQRHGLKLPPEMQIEDMNEDLRVGLWNAFYNSFMSSFISPTDQNGVFATQMDFFYKIWLYALKKPGDEFVREPKRIIGIFKRYFLTAKWNEVFDLVEYAAGKYPREDVCRDYTLETNFVLEKEYSAYRLEDGIVVSIFDDMPPNLAPETVNTPLNVDQLRLQKALSNYSTQTRQKKPPVLVAQPAKRMKTVEGGKAL